MLTDILLVLILAVSCACLVFLLLRRRQGGGPGSFEGELKDVLRDIGKMESALKDEFLRNRTEISGALKETRGELNASFKDNRTELGSSLRSFEEKYGLSQKDALEFQGAKFTEFLARLEGLRNDIEGRLEKIREAVEKKLETLREENTKKLDEMRATVDEKLQTTLEKRLSESFKLVSERLEQVYKGLGEMQSLAAGVGDLKKVLSNVKTKGVLGEYQLGNILEQILSPDQYEQNVKTKEASGGYVEFAVKFPGREDPGKSVWLPIDSKFPTENFQNLLDAYDRADAESVDSFRKALLDDIKRCAKEISVKYIDPPNTTDFAILFLPVEGLYAEVLRISGIIETLQRENRVIIAGPTTMAALLNSLQMGFRTLAIQKRSSEVWSLLTVIKKEFGKFGDMLEKTKKKLTEASDAIEGAERSSQKISKRLSNVQTFQELPSGEDAALTGDEDDTPPA